MKRLVVVFLAVLVSCSSNDLTTEKDMVQSSSFSKKDILGAWYDGTTEFALIDIGSDSILYVDHFESYPYVLRQDSIFIRYPDFIYSGTVYFKDDTLVMRSELDTAKFVRFKGE